MNVGGEFPFVKRRDVLLDFFGVTGPDERRTEAFIRGHKSHGEFSHRNAALMLERLQPRELLIRVFAEIRAFGAPSGWQRYHRGPGGDR